MLTDHMIEAGQTTGAIEDVPTFQEHQFIIQARQFIKGGSDPATYYAAVRRSLQEIQGVERKAARQLLSTIEMALINNVAEQLKKAIEARQGGNTKATKPVDLYRKYHKSLQLIVDRKVALTQIHAQAVLTDLYLEQSQSNGDLDTPEYLDGYTGEHIFEINSLEELVSEDRHQVATPQEGEKLLLQAIFFDGSDTFTGTAPILPASGHQKELQLWAEQCRKDLGWGDTEVNAFLQANRDGFDQDSDEIVLHDDDTDGYTPPTLLPNELVLNKELWWTSRDAVYAFNKSRSRVFDDMKNKGVRSKHWLTTFRTLFVDTYGFKEMIEAIMRVGHLDVVTGAALYLSVAGDYGLMEEDVLDIRGLQTNAAVGDVYVNLVKYAQEWEDDLLTLVQDAISPTSETSNQRIHEYAAHTLDDIEGTMPRFDPNPMKTASWNMGFVKAAIAGADWKQAENSAWAAWRITMDARAAQIYDNVLSKGGTRKQAMSAFWKACNPSIPRPQEKIKSIAKSKMGLVLESGREIHWNIVELKIRKGELDLSGDTKQRLLNKLVELQIGKRVWDLLK